MGCVDVVIETPRGSAQKYDYNPETHFFELKKILPAGMVFPYDFGFVPDTKGEDGDPLDVIVISEFHSFPGCVIKCRLIGVIKAEQSAEKGKKKMIRNDRYLAIPKLSNTFEKIKDIDDLSKSIVREIEDFFVDYNKIQGKEFKALEKLHADDAKRMIKSL
ncbi:MAG TPA: inorganic diphosphatase [Puia sp.]|jgi:inorganic pyrophosphatase|nr:inorganic diphosphatase [Puia sp.]